MEYTREDLIEAKRQIDSTLHKLREALKTFETKEKPERYKSQITLSIFQIWICILIFYLNKTCSQIAIESGYPEIANLFIENEIENS